MAANTAAPTHGAAPGAQAQPATRPFRSGTIRQLTSDGYSQSSAALGAATQPMLPYTPTANSFLRGLWIEATCTTAGNALATAFTGDGPFIVLQSLTFADANQKPIVGPFDGYTLMLVNKLGGYQYNDDPRASANFSAVTGTGATGGSFHFVLYVPLEVDSRDCLGALQNKSSSSTFQLTMTVNTSAAVYATAPTTLAPVNINVIEDGWLPPKPADLTGNPVAQAPTQLGTTQYWTRGSYQALNGASQVTLTQGIGYPIRSFLAVNYGVTAGTRAAGDGFFPSPAQFLFNGTSIWNVTTSIWKDQMSRQYGLFSNTADSANGLENGVYALPFNNDFGLQDGDEQRMGYLATKVGYTLQLVGSFSGNSNLFWVANYVAPAAGAENVASIAVR